MKLWASKEPQKLFSLLHPNTKLCDDDDRNVWQLQSRLEIGLGCISGGVNHSQIKFQWSKQSFMGEDFRRLTIFIISRVLLCFTRWRSSSSLSERARLPNGWNEIGFVAFPPLGIIAWRRMEGRRSERENKNIFNGIFPRQIEWIWHLNYFTFFFRCATTTSEFVV